MTHVHIALTEDDAEIIGFAIQRELGRSRRELSELRACIAEGIDPSPCAHERVVILTERCARLESAAHSIDAAS